MSTILRQDLNGLRSHSVHRLSPLLRVGTVENPGALKRMRQAVDEIGPDDGRFQKQTS